VLIVRPAGDELQPPLPEWDVAGWAKQDEVAAP
jgi:hypothetical protein